MQITQHITDIVVEGSGDPEPEVIDAVVECPRGHWSARAEAITEIVAPCGRTRRRIGLISVGASTAETCSAAAYDMGQRYLADDRAWIERFGWLICANDEDLADAAGRAEIEGDADLARAVVMEISARQYEAARKEIAA